MMGKLGHKLKGGFNYGKKVVNNTVAFGKKHKGKIAAVVAIGGLLLANDKMTSRNEGRERESNAIDQAKMAAAINTQRTNERNQAAASAKQAAASAKQAAATASAKRLMSANTAITHSHGAARDNLVSHLASRPSTRPIPRAPLLPAPPAPTPGQSRGFDPSVAIGRRNDRLQMENFTQEMLSAKAQVESRGRDKNRGHQFWDDGRDTGLTRRGFTSDRSFMDRFRN